MGDRSVVGIKTDRNAPTLYLYSHWNGSARYESLVAAIENAGARAGDHAYFTRIFISTIVGDDWNQETGWGLSINDFCRPDHDDVPVLNLDDSTLEIYQGNKHEDLELVNSFKIDLRHPEYEAAALQEIAELSIRARA